MSFHHSRRNFLQSAALSSLALATTKARASLMVVQPEAASPGSGLTQFVNVFIGTGGHGHTYPGATVPFGMVQLSPDTWNGGWDHCSVYQRDDTAIKGLGTTKLRRPDL